MFNRTHIGLHVGPQGVKSYDLRLRRLLASEPDIASALAPLRGSRARLDVVMSDAYCRYLVMTRPDGIRNQEELGAAVRSRFQLAFGDAQGWQLRHDASPFHPQDFVAGIDGNVLQSLEAEAGAAGLAVASVRPLWVAWARHFKQQTRRGPHWIIAPSGGWLSLGYVMNGRCRQVRSLRLATHGAHLADLLARERALIEDVDPLASIWVAGDGLALDGISTVTQRPAEALWGLAEAHA